MTKKYQTEALAAVHEMMQGLHLAQVIDKKTMREFDESCLAPVVPMPPESIRALRERELLSQSIFALYLNVSKNLISDWERGIKKPSGTALRLLNLVDKKGIDAIA
ncbi:MAG: DNA-binding transcriptional regulator [Moraxellaceae bacterium]|nr:DNA-binding transcriptional regulator [Moraxellaceae bacterium]